MRVALMVRPVPVVPCLLTLLALSAASLRAAPLSDSDLRFFEEKVRPVLATRCYGCHSAQAAAPFGGLRLDSREAVLTGGDSGPAIVPGKPEASRLLKAVRYQTIQMPPDGRLSDEQIAALEEWIARGAPWPEEAPVTPVAAKAGPTPQQAEHWAWQPISHPPLPAVQDAAWVRDPLDRFVLARLEKEGMRPSAPADRRTWLRRVYFDLTGLPPTANEIRQFEDDRSAKAFETVVDRLLAAPQFGERWARHWLDIARFAEAGFGNNRLPYAFSYRDWLIQAFNEDLPYNRFVALQLAADQPALKARKTDLAALGYLSLGANPPRATSLPEKIDDRIDVVSRGLLGVTVACARCHDHKYDPIPTKDYYSLYSVFLNTEEPTTPVVLAKDPGRRQSFYDQRLAERRDGLEAFIWERLEVLRGEARDPAFVKRYLLANWEGRNFSNPQFENLSSERNLNLYLMTRWRTFLRNAHRTADPAWTAWYLFSTLPDKDYARRAAVLARWLKESGGAVNPLAAAEFGAKPPESMDDLAARYAALLAAQDSPSPHGDPARDALRAALRGPSAPPEIPREDFAQVQTEGDYNTSNNLRWRYERMYADYGFRGGPAMAKVVEDAAEREPAYVLVRGNLNDKGDRVAPHFLSILCDGSPKAFTHGSGRLDLARSIADPANPLTSRVFVNRVWQHLFGEGIVRTTSDFGLRGEPPTHPDLLDHLASTFMDDGWSTKRLIRRIVLSGAYRQSSADNPEYRLKDSENRLLWRMNRRRLDFEALRDAMLATAGTLDRTIGGRSFSVDSIPAEPRRTLYAYVEREKAPALLKNFNFADPEQHTPQRYQTTVPQQALFLMNSPFIAEQARNAAARLGLGGPADNAGIEKLYRLVLTREPNDKEMELGKRFLAARAAEARPEPEPRSPWRYGTAALDAKTGRLSGFEDFRYFSTELNVWQGASLAPAVREGTAYLSAKGGAPGDDLRHAVVRRWVSPVTGTVRIKGKFSQRLDPFEQRFHLTNGVRGWVLSSRVGRLGSWTIVPPKPDVNSAEEFRDVEPSFETNFEAVQVQVGDTIDFAVDSLDDPEADDFNWAPMIEPVDVPMNAPAAWDSEAAFGPPVQLPLTPWQELAQVLLLTNEFAFLD